VTTRTSTRTLIFRYPFKLSGADDLQPAGSYVVETDEEKLDTSFPAYRRLTTLIRLPGRSGSAELGRVVDIDPAELEAAQARDAALPVIASANLVPADVQQKRGAMAFATAGWKILTSGKSR
jgi:hypothetical protein